MDEATYIAMSEQHMSSFFRTAYSILKKRYDAEDAVQQALLKAWKFRDKAREGAERAWMMRILINECYNILRQRKRNATSEEIPDIAVPFASSLDTGLYDAIQSLSEELRTPFLLKYMEGMTEKEVATAMSLPLPSVKYRLLRARKTLQKELKEEVSL